MGTGQSTALVAECVCYDRGHEDGCGSESGLSSMWWQVELAGKRGQPAFHDRYQLSSELGRGAFATVHLAQPVGGGGGPRVAVKVADLRTGLLLSDVSPKRREAAVREATLMQRLRGEAHVIGFVEAFIEGGFSYIVMERCDFTLLQVLEHTPELTEDVFRCIFLEMLTGIAAVHAAGVVHRDVKPDNFLCVGRDVTVKLCDFGFAGPLAPGGGGGLCCTGVYGTPPFMAPEMLLGIPYGSPVDVWSVGVCAYTLLLGRFPYEPPQRCNKAMKQRIREGSPAPSFEPKEGRASPGVAVSSAAIGLLQRLLCRAPHERPTAEGALREGFFRPSAWTGARQPCLHPALRAARHTGAFDVCGARGLAKAEVEVQPGLFQEKWRKLCASVGGQPSTEEAGCRGGEEQEPRAAAGCGGASPSEASTDAGSPTDHSSEAGLSSSEGSSSP